MHVPELNRLGASIRVKKDLAFISGGRKFKGAQVMASDLKSKCKFSFGCIMCRWYK